EDRPQATQDDRMGGTSRTAEPAGLLVAVAAAEHDLVPARNAGPLGAGGRALGPRPVVVRLGCDVAASSRNGGGHPVVARRFVVAFYLDLASDIGQPEAVAARFFTGPRVG